jgi:hypothetical protein
MSEEITALFITITIIAVHFAWIPILNLVCPPCARLLERRRLRKRADKRTRTVASHNPPAEHIALSLGLEDRHATNGLVLMRGARAHDTPEPRMERNK